MSDQEPDALQALLDPSMFYHWRLQGLHCWFALDPRPSYCNRGRWLAKPFEEPGYGLDQQEGWPRYYFDLDRAAAEIEAWLDFRGWRIARGAWEFWRSGPGESKHVQLEREDGSIIGISAKRPLPDFHAVVPSLLISMAREASA